METLNGAASLASTGSPCLNFFFSVLRTTEESDLINKLEKAWDESESDTMKLIFHLRDCRGGKGERLQFVRAMKWLIREHSQSVLNNLQHIPEYGYWKDLLSIFIDTPFEDTMVDFYANILRTDMNDFSSAKSEIRNEPKYNISLAAKWAPSEGDSLDKSTGIRKKFRSHLGVSNSEYRKMLSMLRSRIGIVETPMCSGKWDEINYEHVPSLAMNKYKKAFTEHDSSRFNSTLMMFRREKLK